MWQIFYSNIYSLLWKQVFMYRDSLLRKQVFMYRKSLLRNQVFIYRNFYYGNKCLCTETLVKETSVYVQRPLLRKQVFMYMYRNFYYRNKCLCTETLVTETSVYVQRPLLRKQVLCTGSGTCWSTLTNNTSTYTYTFDTKQVLINILAYQNSYNGYARKLQMK